MYACLHNLEHPSRLVDIAHSFSPEVEVTAPGTVVFSIRGLNRLIGSPHQIAAEISRQGAGSGIIANLAIAANPDSAILAAQNYPGVTIIPPGREEAYLGRIPLSHVAMPDEMLETFEQWGLRTLDDIAALPPIGIAERLGEDGVRIYKIVLGRSNRPLRLAPPPTSYRERLELEYPLSQLEPLLFVLGRLLGELCRRLESNSMATNRLTTELELKSAPICTRTLELPVPQNRFAPLLKLLQLDLDAHPPSAPVVAVTLEFHPVEARHVQGGLFIPQGPEPEKLQLTLMRIVGMVGEGNAGSPELLDTHRPDAFRMVDTLTALGKSAASEHRVSRPNLSLRFFRPPLTAKVRVEERTPRHVAAPTVTGRVLESAGPWRSSSDWWNQSFWSRDEWDVALTDGGLYRIWEDTASREWFVEGVYD